MYDVITVGSNTVDVFAKAESELIKIQSVHDTEELLAFPCGSKILIQEIDFLTGGGGTNTAVCFSKLGHKVGYLGKIGRDNNGKYVLDTLKKHHINFLGTRGREMTGFSVILDTLENDRTILTYKGVNDKLAFAELNTKKLKTKWFYFSSMIGESFKTLEKLAAFALEKGIKLAFNPSNYLCEKGAVFLIDLLKKTDLLVLNTEEASCLVGKWPLQQLIQNIMSLGPKQVIITDGKRGSYTIYHHYFYHVHTSPVNVKESTGAGDAFASSFLSGIIKGRDMEFCLRLATANAESVIQKRGAKTGLLSTRKAYEVIRQNKIKIDKRKI